MSWRRFTRLTYVYSRKLRNPPSAVAVFAAVHTFVKDSPLNPHDASDAGRAYESGVGELLAA